MNISPASRRPEPTSDPAYSQRDATKFGRLTLVSKAGTDKRRDTLWYCTCDCGGSKIVCANSLRRGLVKSCGCLKGKATYTLQPNVFATRVAFPIHGLSHTPAWNSWMQMRRRCLDPKSQDFPDYGARGISVCERWSTFTNFYEDMGSRPEGKTLDRINTLGNYEPGNCRWATRREQFRNRTDNRIIKFRGRSMPLCDAAEEFGLNYQTLYKRLASGWGIDRALLTPSKGAP